MKNFQLRSRFIFPGKSCMLWRRLWDWKGQRAEPRLIREKDYSPPLQGSIWTKNLVQRVKSLHRKSRFSPLHRELFSLPCRQGGLGIDNPCEIAELEHQRSLAATAPLSQIITEQNTTIDDERDVLVAKSLKTAKQ